MPFQTIFFYAVLGILSAVFGLQILKRSLALKFIRPIFWASAVFILAYLVYLSYLQYQAFQGGPLGLTLNTVSGIKWFFGYARLHFWNQYLVSFIAALGIFAFAKYLNKKRGEIFLEKEEIYLGALGVFLVGYPAFFFYIILVLLASALASAILLKKGERMPLYYFWMPTAIAVLLAIHFWAEGTGWWISFRF